MNKSTILTRVALAALATALTIGAASADVFDDNFSSTAPPAGSFFTVNGGSMIAGDTQWAAYGISVDVVSATYDSPAAPSSWVDLAGTPGPGGIETSFNLAAGTYTVSFSAMNNSGDAFQVSLGSTSQNLAGTSISVTSNGLWSTYSQSFTVASGLNYLDFYSPSANNGNIGVTNISVAAAPEPSALLAVAGGLFLFWKRSRI